MASHYGFDALSVQIRPGKRPRVEQHFPNVFGEGIPVPDPKMVVLVPAEEEALEVQRREEMIDPGHPLGHAVVVGVFRLMVNSRNFANGCPARRPSVPAEAEVGPDLPKSRTAVANQPQSKVIVFSRGRFRRAEDRSHKVVVEIRATAGRVGSAPAREGP